MRKLFFIIQLLLIPFTSCYSQKIVQKQTEVYKLIEQKDKFIGKPLSVLLSEITIPIKAFSTVKENAPGGFLVLMFDRYDSIRQWRSKGNQGLILKVKIKEAFNWNNNLRKKEDIFKWLKEDEEKYKNLTVAYLSITGEPM